MEIVDVSSKAFVTLIGEVLIFGEVKGYVDSKLSVVVGAFTSCVVVRIGGLIVKVDKVSTVEVSGFGVDVRIGGGIV